MTADDKHIPVLPEETLNLLMSPFDGKFCRIVDGTVGFGGHSSRILERNPDALLLGIDRDRIALNASAERLHFAGDRVTLRHGRFSDIRSHVQSAGWDKVDGILLDIGVSSVQLDTPERGFSYRYDGPLDMRMNPESGMTAADLLNHLPEEDLMRIFRDYGEIRQARQLAREVVRLRAQETFDTCGKFAAVCDRVLKQRGGGGPPAPTLPFQALRIAVNEELKELKKEKNPPRLNFERRYEIYHYIYDLLNMYEDVEIYNAFEEHGGISGKYKIEVDGKEYLKEMIDEKGREILRRVYREKKGGRLRVKVNWEDINIR